MKKSTMVLAMILSGCASGSSANKAESVEPKQPKVEQRCVEVTPEYLAKEKRYGEELKKLDRLLENLKTEMISYYTVKSGKFTNVLFKAKQFVNDYDVVLVHIELVQDKKHVGDVYLILGTKKDKRIVLQAFTKGKISEMMQKNVEEQL